MMKVRRWWRWWWGWRRSILAPVFTCLCLTSIILSYHLTTLKGINREVGVPPRSSEGQQQQYPPQRGILSREPVGGPPLHDPILALLTKIEESYLSASREAEGVVVARGQKLVMTRDLPAYAMAITGTQARDREDKSVPKTRSSTNADTRDYSEGLSGVFEHTGGHIRASRIRSSTSSKSEVLSGDSEYVGGHTRARRTRSSSNSDPGDSSGTLNKEYRQLLDHILPSRSRSPTKKIDEEMSDGFGSGLKTVKTGQYDSSPPNSAAKIDEDNSDIFSSGLKTGQYDLIPQNSASLRLLDTSVHRVRMVAANRSVFYRMEEDATTPLGRVGRVPKTSSPPGEEASATVLHGWRLMLCLTHTDGDSSACLPRNLFTALKPYQRIGRLPGIKRALWRREALCELSLSSPLVLPLRSLAPPCYTHPAHTPLLTAAAQALPDHAQWVLKPGRAGKGVTVIDNLTLLQHLRDKRLLSGQIVQGHWGPPLQVLGSSVSVRLYLLLTSIQPLRAHAHTHALVTFRTPPSRGYIKLEGREWSWGELVEWVRVEGGEAGVRTLVGRTEAALTTLALTADLLLPPRWRDLKGRDHGYRCESCYQLLGVDLVYNTSYCPAIIGVSGQPDLSLLPPVTATVARGRAMVTRDLLKMLVSEERVAGRLREALAQAADNVGIVGIDCQMSHELCLTNQDLQFLLQTVRENVDPVDTWENGVFVRETLLKSNNPNPSVNLAVQSLEKSNLKSDYEYFDGAEEGTNASSEDGSRGNQIKNSSQEDNMTNRAGFVMIYPSPSGHLYNQMLRDLYHSVQYNTSATLAPASFLFTESWRHNTLDVHSLTTAIQAHLRPLPPGLTPLMAGLDLRRSEDIEEKWKRHQLRDQDTCMTDPATAPYLQRIVVEPPVTLTPPFTPLVTSYTAHVEYGVITVRVAGSALHCQAEARLHHKFGSATLVNYTVGLGENRLSLAVVDISHSEPWTLNTYTLTLTRRPPVRPHPPPTSTNHHQVCGLRQECALRIRPTDHCGVFKEHFSSWSGFLSHARTLPPCLHGDAQGRWVLPCLTCDGGDGDDGDGEGCDWSEAVWQPLHCTHHTLSQPQLQDCLAGKTLLFLGDSTTRGMHYTLLERTNGSLNVWEKTHGLKVIPPVNAGQTTFAFAYYPKFWLPGDQRPALDQTLYQLLLRSGPLQNTSDTVVVVGGVHWLAAQHLNRLGRLLKREGLGGARVVVKSPGAGFIVAAPGVHSVSQSDHVRLLEHSLHLASYARQQGYAVVDTFNMTVARYRHFLQGKCACHFHKVKASGGERGGVVYRVEGEINRVYSNILANIICQQQGGNNNGNNNNNNNLNPKEYKNANFNPKQNKDKHYNNNIINKKLNTDTNNDQLNPDDNNNNDSRTSR